MISYIGQFKREKVNSTIREKLKKQKTIYTLMLLGFPLLFLLFDYGYINSPEKISGDRMATCKLTTDSGSIGTAFLVSKNGLLLTARHCVDDVGEGEHVTLNFDKVKKPGYDNLKATVRYLPEDKNDDYAIIKLTSEIDIKPLTIAGEIKSPELYNPKISIIGYPAITSTQSIDKQNSVVNYVLENDSTKFMVGKSFPGYSGGPVIDDNTGEVIGILVSGIVETDNEWLNQYIGLCFCEKIQQVFTDPNTSDINW
jgi:V8-like Glu-specific endopeptidase